MVAGHLQIKRGYYHIVLNYTDLSGNRKTKWKSTGLKTKGNKTRAEALLLEARRNAAPIRLKDRPQLLFADFMLEWLETIRPTIQRVTYASYCYAVKKVIVPYFRERGVLLQKLSHMDIQDFYSQQLERIKAASVLRYHANIHKALKYAVKLGLIPSNPAADVERPRQEKYIGSFLDIDECMALLEAARGTKLEIAVIFGMFYGLRRSEVIGLKWDAIDFQHNRIMIRHTVTSCSIDRKAEEIRQDSAKSKSSYRTLPLVPWIKDWLFRLKTEQEYHRKLCGRSYCTDYSEYIYVDQLGYLVKPNYVSSQFSRFLKEHSFRPIRYHDLRHTCASLLLADGVSMKQIQEWLGHSDFNTTANIYAHLDYSSKISSANSLIRSFSMGESL